MVALNINFPRHHIKNPSLNIQKPDFQDEN